MKIKSYRFQKAVWETLDFCCPQNVLFFIQYYAIFFFMKIGGILPRNILSKTQVRFTDAIFPEKGLLLIVSYRWLWPSLHLIYRQLLFLIQEIRNTKYYHERHQFFKTDFFYFVFAIICGGMNISLRCKSECQFHNIQQFVQTNVDERKLTKIRMLKTKQFYFITTGQIKR